MDPLGVQIEPSLGWTRLRLCRKCWLWCFVSFLGMSTRMEIGPDRLGVHSKSKLRCEGVCDFLACPTPAPEGPDQGIVRRELAARRLGFDAREEVTNFLFEVHTSTTSSTGGSRGNQAGADWAFSGTFSEAWAFPPRHTMPRRCPRLTCEGSAGQAF